MRRAIPILLLALITGCDIGEIEHVGTITFIETDGGFWGIVTEDSTRFRPTNLPVEFHQDGMVIEFEGYVLDEERDDAEWGIPVELTEVEVSLVPGDD